MRRSGRQIRDDLALAGLAAAIVGLVSLCRLLGFGDGLLLGATPASGLALAMGVRLRARGAAAAAIGFGLAALLWGLGPSLAALDAAAHGGAAAGASGLMRAIARRRGARTETEDWLISLAGTAAFAALVAATFALGAAAGALGEGREAWLVPLLALVYQPLGILTFGAVLASLREWRAVAAAPGPALATAALATGMIGLLATLLSMSQALLSPSGVTLLLSLPFCVWVAMQRRSLDGAAISLVAAHVVLALLLREAGGIGDLDYVTGVVYLSVLVPICQLVHTVNLDRLAALAEARAQRDELERRVNERTAKLHATAERALASDAAKTRFIATVSHEVRTPLNGVIGMANVVLAGELAPAVRRNLEIIRTSGFHLLDVINRLLDYSRRDQPIDGADLTVFDLRRLAAEVVEEARFLPYAEGLALRTEVADGLAPLRLGYRHGLRQILTNLVGNAAKFTDRGSVTLRLSEPDAGRIRLEVADTGMGIPESLRERIFEPFERGAAGGRQRHGGTGLGLAITADVVARLGGTIEVESAVGTGLGLPRRPAPPRRFRHPDRPGAERGARPAPRGAHPVALTRPWPRPSSRPPPRRPAARRPPYRPPRRRGRRSPHAALPCRRRPRGPPGPRRSPPQSSVA